MRMAVFPAERMIRQMSADTFRRSDNPRALEGLIQKQDVGLQRHGAHQGGALLQAAGKLAGAFGKKGRKAVILRHGKYLFFFSGVS